MSVGAISTSNVNAIKGTVENQFLIRQIIN